MVEMSFLQALHVCVKDKAHVCMTGQVIECMTFLNTSNSTKTQNVDMNYWKFFSFPASSTHKECLACETSYSLALVRAHCLRFSKILEK